MAEMIAGPVAESFVQAVIGVVKKEVKYVREYKTYVRNMKDGLVDLENARDEVQFDIDKALNDGENIKNAVSKWINGAGVAITAATDLLKKNDNSKQTCFRGIIPNLSTRFQISKQAEEIINLVNKLKGEKLQFGEKISYRGTHLGRVTGTYFGANYHVTKSRGDLLKAINKELMDPSVRIVGVSGISGVGKSALMKQVEKQVSEKRLGYDFEHVTIVTVGQAPNLEKIQDDIAYRLELQFVNENGLEQKAHRLCERLKNKKKTLMIFDDVWKKLDLEKLGIPQGDEYSHIKILLTSRTKDLLMDHMNSKRNLTLEPLEEEEALELFEKLVGQTVKNESTKGLLLQHLAKGCAGLPVFIVPLATKLKRVPLHKWDNSLKDLTRSDSKEMKKFVEETLGINYQVIEAEEVKALFLLCGQIGQQVLCIDDLLIYGMGIGFLKGDTMEECRERLTALLESLKSNGLLEEEASNFIKIHDKVSEASLSIAEKDHPSLLLRDKKSLEGCSEIELKRCKSISFPCADDIHELPEGLICPELMTMFFLPTEGCPLNIPDSFFDGMRKLKVMDLSDAVLTALPPSIELLGEIHTLCLDRCRIEDLGRIGKLKQLRILTFRGSLISRLPNEIGELIHLRRLDLNRCNRLEVIQPGVLGRLIQLEELVLPDTFDRWDVEGVTNASLDELNNMSNLSSLQIHIPDVNALPRDLPFGNLKRYKILIGGRSNCLMEYDEGRTLQLRLNSGNGKIIWEDWVQTTMQSALKIRLREWGGIEKDIMELSKAGFPELKHIDLVSCQRIRYIFHPNERFQFSLLESLSLYGLTNLEKIYHGSLITDPFTNLKSIRIGSCQKLRNLFSISLAKELSGIEEIKVEDCEKMSEIVRFDFVDYSPEHKGGTINNKLEPVAFKRLRTLKLSILPEILSFCGPPDRNRATNKGDDSSQIVFLNAKQVRFPSLESLTLSALPLLKKISDSKSPVKLHRLGILKVKGCKELSNAIDSQLLLQLKKLEQLTIKNCESMKIVFDLDKLSTSEAAKSPVKPKPMSLKLVDLPNLEMIWRINLKDTSLVLNLRQLQVSGCHQLKYMFSLSMAKSLHSISHISVTDCKTMETIFKEEKKDNVDSGDTIEFSSLTELWISDMESLTMLASGNRSFDFPRLKQIQICNCPKMSTFVPSKDENKLSRLGSFSKNQKKPSRTTTTLDVDGVRDKSFFSAKGTLPSLENLVLSSLNSLTNIWENSLSENSFFKLASIEIRNCQNLKTIFPLALMGRLQNLANLEVNDCNDLEVLFESGERDLVMSKMKDMTLGQLPKLKYLVMIKNPSEKAVLGFPNLTNVDVCDCNGLVELFPNAISRTLFELENLKITSCWGMVEVFPTMAKDEEVTLLEEMTFGNLRSLKLESLNSLTSFCTGQVELCFPFLEELSITDCPRLKAFLLKPPSPTSSEDESRPLFDEKVIFPNLLELRIQGLKINEIWQSEFAARFLYKLKVFVVEDCTELSILIPSFMMKNLQRLCSLKVTKCNSLEVIFELGGYTFKGQKLEKSSRSWELGSIELSDLPKLKCICKSATLYDYFPFHNLASLKVESCKRLRSVCRVSKVHIPKKLRELSIEHCESMEQILEYEKGDHTGGCEKIVFSDLSSLKLFKLPKLVTFCAKKIEWPSLEKLEISACDGVEAFVATSEQHFKHLFLMEKFTFPRIETLIISAMSNLKEMWYPSNDGKDLECSSDAFCNLKTLQIDNCDRLSTILSSKMIRGFQNMEQLLVRNCSALEQVFQVQGNGADTFDNEEFITMDFSLRKLQLSNLPMMKQIWTTENPEMVKLSYEKLRKVNIECCHTLKQLFPASIAKYLHQLENVNVSSCNGMEGIVSKESNSTNNYIDGSANPKFFSFPRVTYLGLERLPNLKSTLSVLHSSEWPSLEELKVHGCPNVKLLATEMSNASNHTNNRNEFNNISDEHVNQVEKVNVSRLRSIETDMAYQEDEQFPYDFVNLSSLTLSKIEDQEAVKTFLWKLLLRKIHNVEMLVIRDSSFEELFPFVDEEGHRNKEGQMVEEKEIVEYESGGLACNGKQKHALGALKIHSLRTLSLLALHKLKHVWEQDSSMAEILNIVESLFIQDCPFLKILFPASASFVNLTQLWIYECDGMVHLVTSSAARCLVQLTELVIMSCANMENIVIEDEDECGVERVNVAASISFPRLKVLQLASLEKLESFSPTTCHFHFSSLESVLLLGLPKLGEDFCKGNFTAPLLHGGLT